MSSGHETFFDSKPSRAGKLAPENTLEAFRLGWKLGTVPEADIRTTRDGVIVAFHDANFARVVSGIAPEMRDWGVADVSFAVFSQLDVGGEHPSLPTHRPIVLEDAFLLLREQPARQLYLDIKDVDLEALVRLVSECGVQNQVIFAATDYAAHLAWRKLLPSAPTLLWMGGEQDHLDERLNELRATNFAGISQLQIHVRWEQTETKLVYRPEEAWLRHLALELRERGILFQTLPWNASEPAIYQGLLEIGVESFATDYPEIALEVVKNFAPSRNRNEQIQVYSIL